MYSGDPCMRTGQFQTLPRAALLLLFEEGLELRSRISRARRLAPDRISRGSKILAEVRAVLVHDTIGLRLAALIMERRIVMSTIQTRMCRPIARWASVAKPDALLEFDVATAMETVHTFGDGCPVKTLFFMPYRVDTISITIERKVGGVRGG
jgi:hypothetical protein